MAEPPGTSPGDAADPLRPALDGCATGDLPPNVALLRLAMNARGPAAVEAALAREAARRLPQDPAGAGRLHEALRLWRDNPQAFDTVKAVLEGVEHDGGPDPDGGIARWADAFDRLARASPEGGVALYALGNPDLLRAATAEVVGHLDEWGLLGPDRRVLEVGCGIGRFVAALAPRVAHVTGLDTAPGMIVRARERCAGLPNVALAVSSGRDLAGVPDESLDLVLAADVFPYFVQGGEALARRHVEEAARVLGPSGHLLVLNYSYRGDLGRDRDDLARLAAGSGLAALRLGTRDLRLWDATAFLLEKP